MSGVAVILRRNAIAQRFRAAGALSAESAKGLSEIGERDGFMLRALVRRGVIVEPQPGRFFLDDEAFTRFKNLRKLILFGALAVVALVLVVRHFQGG